VEFHTDCHGNVCDLPDHLGVIRHAGHTQGTDGVESCGLAATSPLLQQTFPRVVREGVRPAGVDPHHHCRLVPGVVHDALGALAALGITTYR